VNIKLDLENGVYVVIEKSSYGFNLNIHTPTSNEKAKNSHSVNTLFYPDFKAIAKKLVWLGMDGESIEGLTLCIQNLHYSLSKQLTKTWESMGDFA
jgi:hypothetical protein